MTEEVHPHETEGNAAGLVAKEATPAASSESSPAMTRDAERPGKSIWRRRITLISGATALIAAIVVLPPLINIGRYQRQVTALMSQSLGRPVSLSSVGLRLLPWPGFVLHDLTVGEDPAFGAEPVLSARTVVASVRIFSLWRGRAEISRISVDDASLNLVRSEQGRWNLESLMLGAQPVLTAAPGGQRSNAQGKPRSFPYLEATNSRVNLKKGVEKGPFSLVNTDLSLWQDEPGQWRVRLSGQPFRTDMEMSLADTGEVRVEGSLQTASQLRDMPLKLQVTWREAQLGELSRLILGSDAGWRGDLTADVGVQGTLDDAQTKARLRATGVRRQEFAPESPLDFDANCSLRFQHSQNAVHDVDCNTAIGDGRLHLKGEIPGDGGQPEGILEVKQVSLQAGLDLLRTVRSGFAPGINARGTLNGELSYKVVEPESSPASGPGSGSEKKAQAASLRHGSESKAAHRDGTEAAVDSNLKGALTLEGASLRGGALKEPLVLPKAVWAPTPGLTALRGAAAEAGGRPDRRLGGRPGGLASSQAGGHSPAKGPETVELGTRFSIPMAASPASSPAASAQASAQPQAVTVRVALGRNGYEVTLGGSAPAVKLRDLVYALGSPRLDAADSLTGGIAELDLTAAGPWIAPSNLTVPSQPAAGETAQENRGQQDHEASAPLPEIVPVADSLGGTVQLRHFVWKPSYLASAVELPQGVVTISRAGFSMNSDFSFGTSKDTLKGTAQLTASPECKGADCQPQITLRFAALDAGVMQAALLGAPAEKSLLSPLIDRVRSSDRPKWPAVTLNVQAENLVLGPITLHKPNARIKMEERDIALEHWDAGLMGGTASGTGHFTWSADSPKYAVDGTFAGVNAAQVGELVQSQWKGGTVSGSGSVQLTGLTDKDLAASAAGELKFNWQHGALALGEDLPATDSKSEDVSEDKDPELVRFESWTGVLAIKAGKVELGENTLFEGKRHTAVTGTIPFGGPVKLSLGRPADGRADHAPRVAAKAGQIDRKLQ
jgi:uncharacterized protein involved in outer membrane biogenesis